MKKVSITMLSFTIYLYLSLNEDSVVTSITTVIAIVHDFTWITTAIITIDAKVSTIVAMCGTIA